MLSDQGFFSLGKGAGKWIGFSALMLFINGAAYILEVFLIADFIGRLAEGRLQWDVIVPGLLLPMAAVLVVKAIASRLNSMFSYHATVRVKRSVRRRIFSKVEHLGPSYTDQSGTAELIANAIDGVEALEIFFGRFVPQLLYSLTIPLGLFFVTYRFYPAFAWIMLAAVPVIPLSMGLISRWAVRSMKGFWNDYQGLSALFLENLQGLVTLKLFNKSEKRMQEMEAKAWGFRNSTMELLRMQLTSISVMDTLVYGFAGLGIFLAVRGLYTGGLPVGGFFCLLVLSIEFFLPIRKLGSLFHAGVNGIQAGKKIASFLNSSVPQEPLDSHQMPKGSAIEFDQVTFSYSDDLPAVLIDADFKFDEGGTYGIAGSSGCGKSTLGRMILRFYDPVNGRIRLGGVPMHQIPRAELRRRITLVEARSYIFDGTLEDNLKLAVPDASSAMMLEACKAAGLGSLVREPEDLKKETGESGSKLSGGERQRLAIARAILLDPDVFVFDEAAGSVDAESEEIIKQTIYGLPKNKTVLIISHRMSMLDRVDRLLTIDSGKICDYNDACRSTMDVV